MCPLSRERESSNPARRGIDYEKSNNRLVSLEPVGENKPVDPRAY